MCAVSTPRLHYRIIVMVHLPDGLDLREIGTRVRWEQSACALLLGLWPGLLIGFITEANSLCPACDGCLLQTHDSLREEL